MRTSYTSELILFLFLLSFFFPAAKFQGVSSDETRPREPIIPHPTMINTFSFSPVHMLSQGERYAQFCSNRCRAGPAWIYGWRKGFPRSSDPDIQAPRAPGQVSAPAPWSLNHRPPPRP
ncbi:hypothetical protein B0H67DRAFT_590950, partial [Lasiosphaeris hirsuta]